MAIRGEFKYCNMTGLNLIYPLLESQGRGSKGDATTVAQSPRKIATHSLSYFMW